MEGKLVLVTGASGLIASHCIKQLLENGYRVRGTVRSVSSDNNQFLRDLPGAERLELVAADLNDAESFKPACKDVEFVMHIASPYILTVKDPQKDLVDPAVNGALAVLKAAKEAGTVRRLVLTSSMAAISDEFTPGKVYTENDWNETSSLSRNPYYYSKKLAEKAAWDWMQENDPPFQMVVINPFAVLGASLDNRMNTSFGIISTIASGELKWGSPNVSIGIVHVLDVARAHILALENTQAQGRYVCANVTMSYMEMAKIIQEARPELARNMPTRTLPDFMVKVFAMFQPSGIRDYLRLAVGKPPTFDNSKILKDLGMTFRDPEQTIRDTLEFVIKVGDVKLPS